MRWNVKIQRSHLQALLMLDTYLRTGYGRDARDALGERSGKAAGESWGEFQVLRDVLAFEAVVQDFGKMSFTMTIFMRVHCLFVPALPSLCPASWCSCWSRWVAARRARPGLYQGRQSIRLHHEHVLAQYLVAKLRTRPLLRRGRVLG